MKNSQGCNVAIISSLTGGLGHYCAHLADPLSKLCDIKFITYPQVDLTGTVTKQITDSFVKRHIKWPRFDIDESNSQSILTIRNYIVSHNIKVVNVHIGTTVKRKITYFTTLFNYLRYMNDVKIIFTLHDVMPFDEDKKVMNLLEMFYSLADHFNVGNTLEKSKLMKTFHIPEKNIDVIPHGIYDLFNKNIYTQATARNFLGIPEDVNVFLFFGFLREYKGFKYLIRASKLLQKKHDNFIVYVATGLRYASESLIEKSMNEITKLGLDSKFYQNFNYLDTHDIEAVFKASDAVVLPYTHASQSGVLMMSASFKKPVVITEAFYDKVWIRKKAGLVADTKDPTSLAEKMSILMTDKELSNKMGQYCYDYASTHFRWDQIAQKYFDMYQKVLKK